MRTKKGFTLVELVMALLAVSVILVAGMQMIGLSASGFRTSNKKFDIETDVRTSLKNMNNILSKARQIFFVDSQVFRPDMDLKGADKDKLDPHYGYIAVKNNGAKGNIVVNVFFDGKLKSDGKIESGEWREIPITSVNKSVDIQNDAYIGKLDYKTSFYKDDKDYMDKIAKGIINVTISGTVDTASNTNKEPPITYELSEDIFARNVNQILLSSFMTGGPETITAIAYSNEAVKEEVTGSAESYAIALVLDLSGSMIHSLGGNGPDRNLKRNVLLKDTLMDSTNGFYRQLQRVSEQNKGNVDVFLLGFSFKPKFVFDRFTRGYDRTKNGNEFNRYDMRYIKDGGGGPFDLHKPDDYNTIVRTTRNWLDSPYGGTNLGEAILQAEWVLSQSDRENKYLIVLTDGAPSQITTNVYSGVYHGVAGERPNTFTFLAYNVKNAMYVRFEGLDKYSNNPYNFYLVDNIPNKDVMVYYSGEVGLPGDVSEYTLRKDAYSECEKLVKKGGREYDIKYKIVGAGRYTISGPRIIKSYNYSEDYVKTVTDSANGYNKNLQRVFLIAFSGDENDKKFMKEKLPSYFASNPELKLSDKTIQVFDAGESASLAEAFKAIRETIEIDMSVFDGPKPGGR